MKYNVSIKTARNKFSILKITEEDLQIIVNAFEKGKNDFFINGKKYWISNLIEIKIIELTDIDKFYNISGTKLNRLKAKGHLIINHDDSVYFDPFALMEFGNDVTRTFIKGDFGFKKEQFITPYTYFNMDIFISHSNEDQSIAKKIIDIINKAYNIEQDKIRCTSVPGYKLPIGSYTDEQLRDEIFSSKVFIALITDNSIKSTYVQFELGARWGQKLPLFPLICDKKGVELLEGPLRNINALDASKETGIIQFIEDLGTRLSLTSNKTSSYIEDIKELTEEISKRQL